MCRFEVNHHVTVSLPTKYITRYAQHLPREQAYARILRVPQDDSLLIPFHI